MEKADTERLGISIDLSVVPVSICENMAEKVLKGARSFFANPDNAAKYRKWLEEREARTVKSGKEVNI